MSKGKIAIGILVLAIVGFLFIPAFLPKNGLSASMGVTFYDENGDPLPPTFAIVNPTGVVVDKLVTKTTWALSTASGATIEDAVLSGSVVIVVRLNTITAGVVKTVTHTITETGTSALSGDASFTDYLSSMIGTPTTDGKTYGWGVTITGTLDASGIVNGDEIYASWTDEIYFSVKWETDSLVLTGTIGYT